MDLKTAKVLGNGGRALNAIWTSEILASNEKLLLAYLGSQLDFRGTFGESRWVSLATFMANTSLSKSTVKRVLDSLEAAGYIVRQHHFKDGRQLANSYKLTDLIFEQYAARLPKSILGGISIGGGQPASKNISSTAREVEQDAAILTNIPHEQAGEESTLNMEEFTLTGGEVHCEPVEGSTVDTVGVHGGHPYTPSIKSSLRKAPSFNGDKKGKYKDPTFNEAVSLARLLFNPGGRGRWIDIKAIDAWTDDVLARHGIETLRKLKADAVTHQCLGQVAFDPPRLESWIKALGQTATDDAWMDVEGF